MAESEYWENFETGAMPKDVDLYVEAVGHEPPQAPEEDAWQWRYRGSKAEREMLLDLIQAEAEEAHEQLSIC